MMKQDKEGSFSQAKKVRLKNGTLNLSSVLRGEGSVSFYQFRVTNRSSFNCFLGRLPGDVELNLYNRNRKMIASSDERDGRPEFIRSNLDAGIYYLEIKQKSGDRIKYSLRSSLFEKGGANFSEALKIKGNKGKLKGNFVFRDSLSATGNRFAFYQFNLTEQTTFTTLLGGLKANADIELFNSNRQRISFSANGGISLEKITQVLEAGNYFIRVKIKGGKTQFKLKCFFSDDGTDLGGDSIDKADPVNLSTTLFKATDAVGGLDPQDFYKVEVASPTNLKLTLNNLSADANLQIFGSDGTTVLGSSSNPGTAQDLIDLNLNAGTYFVKVFPATSTASTNYNLEFLSTPLRFFGLTDTNSLVAFNSDKLNGAVSLNVTGLTSGETLKSIDFRPATGHLLGLSSASKLYSINLATGAATQVGTGISPALTGTATGFDFNPVVDRVRVVTDTDTNLRLNPDTGAIAATDTNLTYAVGDPNAAANPNVVAAAYTNNFAGAISTTLYGIDSTLDRLVRQGDLSGFPTSPNAGTLSTVGALGVDFGATTGFDIFTDSSLVNTAYATSGSALYSINLTTGAATSLGTVSAGTGTGTGTGTTASNLIGLAIR